jgi:ubiquinone/menaquinone biosynthesis C-methylase UbiE
MPLSAAARRPVRSGVGALLRRATGLRMRGEKLFWRGLYEAANRGGKDPGTALMNYGYAPLDGDGLPDGGPDRFGLALYEAVAGAVDLTGADVLEIGCGRGGGTAFVAERLGARTVTGVDLAAAAVARCRAAHQAPNLRFATADAEHLPYADGSFDAVVNVESSHCYPDMERFLAEVRRVLRPGGHLLLADFRHTALEHGDDDGAVLPQEDLQTLRRQLGAAGFRTVEEQDITPNVLRALALDSDARRGRIEARLPRPLRGLALDFSGVEGSAFHRALDEREMTYERFVLRRV